MACCETLRDPVFHVSRFDYRIKQHVNYQQIGLAGLVVLAALQLISTHSSPCQFNLDVVLQTSAREEIQRRPKMKQCRIHRQQRNFKEAAHFKSEWLKA